MNEFVCCLDFGTTRIKAALLDATGNIASLTDAPAPGGGENFEFDPETHFSTGCDLIRSALRGASTGASDVAALCVTNQRSTVLPVGADSLACGPALSWQDTRCAGASDAFALAFGAERFGSITGLPPSALWSLSKILWLREAHPDIFRSAARFVFLHDYILRRFGADDFVTDYSNASLSGMLDIDGLAWSGEILAAAKIDAALLPRLAPAGSVAGELSAAAASLTGLRPGTPLVVGGGDQQCAALGVGAVDEGAAGLCLGTAAVLSCPAGHPVRDPSGGFFSTAHVVPGRWVVEGFFNTFGSSIKWGAELLGVGRARELEALAAGSPPGANGVTFLPFLAGTGSPDFDAGARGAFLGLHLSHGRADAARAIIEGVCLEMRRIIDAVERFVGVGEVIVSGGLSAQSLLPECLAGITGKTLLLSGAKEATLSGAALLAWAGAGAIGDIAAASRARAGADSTTICGQSVIIYKELSLYETYLERVKSLTGSSIKPNRA